MLSVLYLLRLNLTILFLLIILFLIVIDILTFKGIRFKIKSTYKNFLFCLYWFFSLIIYFVVFYFFYIHKWQRNPHDLIHLYNFSAFSLIIYLPKTMYAVFCCIQLTYNFIIERVTGFPLKIINNFFQKTGLIISIIAFLVLLCGFLFGRYRYEITINNLKFSNLPVSFNNLKIVQISDLHIGTYINNPKQIDKVVSIINRQNPDLVFFTGDMVNSFAEEMPEFLSSLKKIHANIGKFAVLGNHDYGDYYLWKEEKDRAENHLLLNNYIEQAGFKLLLNENKAIIRNKDTIYVAGTENWGKLPYRQAGDLNQSVMGIGRDKFVMLLSHDPVFWDIFVTKQSNIEMTFSGHTHGMQFGIRVGKFEWTPFQLGNKRWSGLYKKNKQYLYVNKGLGSAMYTGRLGMWPEISVFELHSSN